MATAIRPNWTSKLIRSLEKLPCPHCPNRRLHYQPSTLECVDCGLLVNISLSVLRTPKIPFSRVRRKSRSGSRRRIVVATGAPTR